MKEAYIKKYNELVKKNEILDKRYAQLEKMEKDLDEREDISEETKLQNLKKLAEEYEKIAKLMHEISVEAEELRKSVEAE